MHEALAIYGLLHTLLITLQLALKVDERAVGGNRSKMDTFYHLYHHTFPTPGIISKNSKSRATCLVRLDGSCCHGNS